MYKFIAGAICGALIVLAIHHPAETKKTCEASAKLAKQGFQAAKVAIAKIQK